jgi:hypothetical protein
MPEYDWVNTLILVSLWVGLLYGLFELALGYLALTDLEWRQLIGNRLRQEWRGMRKLLVQCSRFKVEKPKPPTLNFEP